MGFFLRLGPDQPVVKVLVKSESSGEGHELHFLYVHCKDMGAVASPKGRVVNWNTCDKTLGISLSLGGWGCEGKRPIGLLMIPIPLELMRS